MTGNRAIKHWTLLLLSCCILLPSLLRAEEARGRESILIISSYNPDTRRMSSFITEFERQVVASGVPCDIYVETLECKSINDAPLWISQTDNLITRYESKGGLRAIVLLGQEAWASFVSLGRIPKEVMCFSCFVSSNGIVFPPPSDSADVWMPRSINYMNMVDSLHNVGGLLNKYDIRRNIELIRTLYPEVENLAFISDNTYGGISLQALVREEMENYPDLNLVLVDSRDGDEASHAAYASLSPRSAVMLGTWRVGSDGEYLMQRSLNDLVQLNPRLPVFSITRTGIGDVAVGGFVPNYENGANVIAAQIKEYYKTGSLGGVHFHLSDGEYVFDSRKLKELKIAEYALPKGSVIEDTVAAKLSKYSHYIELLVGGIVLLVLLLIFVAFLFLRTRRLKRTLEEREGQLVIAREKAEESDMLKSAFLANMSHEIRTPLNAIVGFSNLLTETDDPEERRDYLRVVEENNDLLLTLISDILDLSKIEAGTFEFNYGPVDVNQMCEEVVRSLSLKVQGRPVELRFVGPGSPCFILGDKGRLTQVITNFINNAVKFTAEGSITLSYAVEGTSIRFAVEDTGSGIDKEHLDNIFERFVKLNSFVQGTGLGLSISKSIVEQMGGQIGVESEPGKGACFWFTVPMGTPEALPDSDTACPPRMTAQSASRSGRRPVLLIAEDTDSNYLLLSLMLRKEYEVIRAGDGEEVVRLCEQIQPDAVLMDIQMPVMDGLKATQQIRRSGSRVPIIAVTAYAYDRDRQKALEAGCDEYLAKPLTGDTLRQTLHRLLAGE